METVIRTVRLEVFSDYTCPWCYVGWARLEKALASLPETVVAEVEWRPFEIHPEVPTEGMPVENLPYSSEDWARMQEALRLSAEAEGLDVGKRPKVSNTHRALVAGAYVQTEEPSRFPDFHELLFKAYFRQRTRSRGSGGGRSTRCRHGRRCRTDACRDRKRALRIRPVGDGQRRSKNGHIRHPNVRIRPPIRSIRCAAQRGPDSGFRVGAQAVKRWRRKMSGEGLREVWAEIGGTPRPQLQSRDRPHRGGGGWLGEAE